MLEVARHALDALVAFGGCGLLGGMGMEEEEEEGEERRLDN